MKHFYFSLGILHKLNLFSKYIFSRFSLIQKMRAFSIYSVANVCLLFAGGISSFSLPCSLLVVGLSIKYINMKLHSFHHTILFPHKTQHLMSDCVKYTIIHHHTNAPSMYILVSFLLRSHLHFYYCIIYFLRIFVHNFACIYTLLRCFPYTITLHLWILFFCALFRFFFLLFLLAACCLLLLLLLLLWCLKQNAVKLRSICHKTSVSK